MPKNIMLKKEKEEEKGKIICDMTSVIHDTFYSHFKSIEKHLIESSMLEILTDPVSYCDYLVKTYVEKLDKEILIGIDKNTINKTIGYDFINCLVKLFSICNLLNYANKIDNMTVYEKIKYHKQFTGNCFDDDEESLDKLAIFVKNYISSLKSMHEENNEKYKNCVLDKYNDGQINTKQLNNIMNILLEDI